MDANNNPFNTQNSTNYFFNYPNPNNYRFQIESSNQRVPQNIPNYGFPPKSDQPRYGSQVGGNTGSGNSGSKRAHESDASDFNSIRSSVHPMRRDASKKRVKRKSKGAALESVNEEWNEFKQYKEKELELLEK
jgi:hypothetical protein